MLHEALMLEIYRQALNAGALPTARPRSTESANSSERCPSHESNSSENGKDHRENSLSQAPAGVLPLPSSPGAFPAIPNMPAQPPSMEAYLHMVAAAAQQYGFPLGAGPRLPLPLPTEAAQAAAAAFKMPPQASPTASSNHSEALDFRTNPYARSGSAEPVASDEEEEEEEVNDGNNPLDLSCGTRKRSAEDETEADASLGQIQVKKIFKSDSPPLAAAPPPAQQVPPNHMMPGVNPYLAAVAAANIFRSGQFPDWNGKSDLVVDPLEKMSDIVKGPRKEKNSRPSSNSQANAQPVTPQPPAPVQSAPAPPPASEGITKTRHNIWQSHWQNKGVASSVFRCVWCKQSFPTLEALTTHMKDSKHCGVNVPPFGNLPTANERPPPPSQPPPGANHLRQPHNKGNNSGPSQAAKNAFQYRGDPPTPLPRKLVRGQNVWLGKGVEQAMQILKCMRCGESFRSLNEMTKHMQETQHYTNILSQEQTISMKSTPNSAPGESKEGQSLSSEESRTLSAVLTCKVCDKAFNSLGDLSNHMAKNNHYAEPLMQSMGGGAAGNRKRPAPKKREKSLPVRKLLEMKGAQDQLEQEMEMQKMQRPGMGPGSDKTEAALFAERMRQYISGIKPDEPAKNHMAASNVLNKTKSPDLLEPKNGATKAAPGSSSVLSAIEQMFTTSFDTPPRHASLPATSPSNSSTKNTSPVASNILKRLGIDENVDYNKPLIDTSDPYYQHYRYTSSERSASECSAETHNDSRKMENPTPDKSYQEEAIAASHKMDCDVDIKREMEKNDAECATNLSVDAVPKIKQEIKAEIDDEGDDDEPRIQSPKERSAAASGSAADGNAVNSNGTDYSLNNNNNNNNNTKECQAQSPKLATSPQSRLLPPRSPTDSHRSLTPKSPASSIKSYDGGEKKYPSDSLNALSSMFDSLGSTTNSSTLSNRPQPQNTSSLLSAKLDSPENLTTSNSLAALRQFCIKKEKTA
ncbi:protein teashirt [Stomoxys calcitrans]|uniref:protein teashirt n=1 Tax=Stomoxys calcitrans TaxID=35570 RepID=UPI0027E37E08|nr:protein teashirt [Stomoxys calcitrans]